MEVHVIPSFSEKAPPITDWLTEELRRFITVKVGYDVQVHITMPAESVQTATDGSETAAERLETFHSDVQRDRGEGM